MKRLLFALAALCSAALCSAAERPRITSARFEPDSVMIGDRFVLSIDLEKDKATPVQFPSIDKNFAQGRLEVIKEYAPDTLKTSGSTICLRKRYEMTSFDEAYYVIDSVAVLYADRNIIDTVFYDRPLQLTVAIIPVDTAKTTIYDIKQPMRAPLMVGEVKGYAVWTVVGISALLSIIYFWSKRRRHSQDTAKQRPKEAPHITAIRELEHLHNQKLWQNNRHKQYYTRLTDILREYLAGRFGISAREMTSDEIIEALKSVELTDKQRREIADVLRESDLVKFAKHTPENDRNEESYYKVYYFVEETKQVEEEQKEAAEPERIVEL